MIPDALVDAGTSSLAKVVIPGILADGSLYPIEKLEAHRSGVFHLAVSVFVFCRGHLLLQRRALTKYHCGGQWANTCCTHPHWGESVGAAAERRLQEELGFWTALTYRRVVEYAADVGNGLHEHERVYMFTAQVDRASVVVVPDPAEVSETRWISAQDLRREITVSPQSFTPWLRIYIERYPDLIL